MLVNTLFQVQSKPFYFFILLIKLTTLVQVKCHIEFRFIGYTKRIVTTDLNQYKNSQVKFFVSDTVNLVSQKV